VSKQQNADPSSSTSMPPSDVDTVSVVAPATNLDIASVAKIEGIASILEVVCRTTGMGFAAVARVTEDRWVACAVRDEIAFGLLPGGELNIKTTICDEIRANGRAVIIDHVAEDEAYREHHTPAMYGFQSYISIPVMLLNGTMFGTLCAIDPRPAKLHRPEVIGMFKNFAQLIAFHLDAQDRAKKQEAVLFGERQTAELREQFIAILAHDLRNPLASIDAGAAILARQALNEKARTIVGHMQTSAKRMSGLVNDMLDFARGRLGGGFPIERDPKACLTTLLDNVIGELRDAWPNRIQTHFAIAHPVNCDPNRIGQLLSNLAGNALKHGAQGGEVRISASTTDKDFELAVSNQGEPIDPATIGRLFLPFFRLQGHSSNQGLGLGLYIASEIARAHGGTINVASSAGETTFTLRMPRG
jgi:signal transduction histidine kinase